MVVLVDGLLWVSFPVGDFLCRYDGYCSVSISKQRIDRSMVKYCRVEAARS